MSEMSKVVAVAVEDKVEVDVSKVRAFVSPVADYRVTARIHSVTVDVWDEEKGDWRWIWRKSNVYGTEDGTRAGQIDRAVQDNEPDALPAMHRWLDRMMEAGAAQVEAIVERKMA